MVFKVSSDALTVAFNVDALYPNEPPFQYLPEALDPLLVEVLATAHFLQASPDIRRLEEAVRQELA
jgi:hypothetical protein